MNKINRTPAHTVSELAIEEIRGKINLLGIKPDFLRRLGPSVTKEELESVYKKNRVLNSHFRGNVTFYVCFQ